MFVYHQESNMRPLRGFSGISKWSGQELSVV